MSRPFLLALLALTLVRELLYIAVTPPFQGPDEPGHFEYVALIYRLGRIPQRLPNTEIDPALIRAINAAAGAQRFEIFHPTVSLRRLSEQEPPVLAGPREAGYQRPTYYLLLLPVYALFSGADVLTQYYALAVASSLLAVVTVLAAALAASRLFPADHFAQAALPLLVAFWPTQTYLMSRLNNDNLATAVGAATLCAVVMVLERGLRVRTTLALAGLGFMALMTKGTTLFLLPVMGLAVAVSLTNRLPAERRRRLFLRSGVVAALGLVAGGALFFSAPLAAALAGLMGAAPWASVRGWAWLVQMLTVLGAGLQWAPDRLAANRAELGFILRSFWAIFGWGRTFLAPAWYWAALLTVGLAGSGLLLGRLRQWGRPAPAWQGQALALLALAFGLAWVPLAARMIFDPFTTAWHGRSLLPTLLPVGAFLALGLSGLVPERGRTLAVRVLLAALILVDTASLAGTIVPYFYR